MNLQVDALGSAVVWQFGEDGFDSGHCLTDNVTTFCRFPSQYLGEQFEADQLVLAAFNKISSPRFEPVLLAQKISSLSTTLLRHT